VLVLERGQAELGHVARQQGVCLTHRSEEPTPTPGQPGKCRSARSIRDAPYLHLPTRNGRSRLGSALSGRPRFGLAAVAFRDRARLQAGCAAAKCHRSQSSGEHGLCARFGCFQGDEPETADVGAPSRQRFSVTEQKWRRAGNWRRPGYRCDPRTATPRLQHSLSRRANLPQHPANCPMRSVLFSVIEQMWPGRAGASACPARLPEDWS
jgi:hypothetical protein